MIFMADMPEDQMTGLRSGAGRAAIASGTIGLVAFGLLIVYLKQRETNPHGDLVIRLHDASAILQYLLMIPVLLGLQRLSQKRPSCLGQVTLVTGIGALLLAVICLLLVFSGLVWDALYMFPQGVFGGWLMFVNWRLAGSLPGWLRWFGVVVGFGLVLVGLFPLGYAVLVDPVCLRIPVVVEDFPTDFTPTNVLLHQLLAIGSCLGVATLPIWSALLGWHLLRASRT